MDLTQLTENVLLELKRGVTTLVVMMVLQEEQYGYSLQSNLAEKGIVIEQGTLYPLLRRLESQELLTSIWRMEGARPRRYYVISPAGKEMLPQLIKEWNHLVDIVAGLQEK
jgi:PadR family transcriptional regulator, regulatory protein PadR